MCNKKAFYIARYYLKYSKLELLKTINNTENQINFIEKFLYKNEISSDYLDNRKALKIVFKIKGFNYV
tara:strand:- start:91 stop:294 length:204 start_codon:yes stop_codon:yes gene_type:complete